MHRQDAFEREATTARRYTHRWHHVRAWALDTIPGDISERGLSPRVHAVRGSLVLDAKDDEEAEFLGQPLEWWGPIQLGPRGVRGAGPYGGRRRVVIRLLTWVQDPTTGGLYGFQWITSGQGMSARAASADHNRYIRRYRLALIAGTESRRLVATEMEIALWTAAMGSTYV